ncbi:hypothetical protein HD806DRAFT_534469 [Xylariaceae sp. AK1471]|nr:hypothetical protein HD806DRAFT_534469 [Xylariaceae sp. AK1471]
MSSAVFSKTYLLHRILTQGLFFAAAMAANQPAQLRAPQNWKEKLQLENRIWREYREDGRDVGWSAYEIDARYSAYINDPLPTEGILRFFNNRNWTPKYITAYSPSQAYRPDRLTDAYPPDGIEAQAQKQYRDLATWFGVQPRYVVQKSLGFGGRGMAALFQDRGPGGLNRPGRDIVVKVPLEGWQDDDIVEEKRMMRKVKGSAHCVQIIEPQDVGKPEDEPVILPLRDYDSSVDGDSSGNESSTPLEVRKNYRRRARKNRTEQYRANKRRRKEARNAEIEEQIAAQNNNRDRRDYIIMEYVQHGNLDELIVKLVKLEDSELSRVPNRVLWGFWLCMIRACIAMEYPPRKFHPLRKRPEGQGSAIDYATAKARGMIRECRRLGIKLFNATEYRRNMALYTQLEGDLIENIPRQVWKRGRRQNMIHRDIDPTNVFIDGLELDEPALLHWQEARANIITSKNSNANSESPAKQGLTEGFAYTGQRPDRLSQEHELVPRLKLADFGHATCIKQQKSNKYYAENRVAAKDGYYPPEYFGPEWEKIEPNEDGDDLANSRSCGYYSSKTNIWSMAMTMWVLITKYEPPIPPQPQLPDNMLHLDIPYNNQGKRDIDDFLDQDKPFPISYCPLLMNPRINAYDWVDKPLRSTLFKCMYHKPDDRPSLQELLDEAEQMIEMQFAGEDDNTIRDWIQRLVFDADPTLLTTPTVPGGGDDDEEEGGGSSGGENGPPNPPEGGDDPVVLQPPLTREQLQAILAREDPSNELRQRLQGRLVREFPNGWNRIINHEGLLRCGLRAVVDSLESQLGLNPIINGVAHAIPSLPTVEDLLIIHQQYIDGGFFRGFGMDNLTAQRNFGGDVLHLLLNTWGQSVNINLGLAWILEGRDLPMSLSEFDEGARAIWIYNDNVEDLVLENGDKKGNTRLSAHWEGIQRNPPPKPPPEVQLNNDGDDLPDYEEDEE